MKGGRIAVMCNSLYMVFAEKRLDRIKPEYALFLIGFLANMAVVFLLKYPVITDEYVIIAEGIYLSGGADWSSAFRSIHNTGYYGFGVSAVYGLLFWFTNNMRIIYLSAITLNSILVSLIPLRSSIMTHNNTVRHTSIKAIPLPCTM